MPDPLATTPDSIPTTPPSVDSGIKPQIGDDDFLTYEKAKLRIDQMVSDFSGEITNTELNRDTRFKDLDIRKLRNAGILKEDQWMIPIRTIDANIRREQPAFVNYLKQSRRLCIFKNIKDPSAVTTKLEEEFTRGMTYSGWEIPHFKIIDGAQTHGWDWMEVVFDSSKPFNVGLEHIGHEKLLYPLDGRNIQDCELIIRWYCVTPRNLKQFVNKFGFNKIEVDNLLAKGGDKNKEKSVNIYKCFWKVDDIVWVAWYCKDSTTWLKEPAELYLGRIEIDKMTGTAVEAKESFYPIFLLPYFSTEQQRIADNKGRVFLDKHKQEALTTNISQFLNGCQLASSLFVSSKTEPLRTSELQSIKLKDRVISSIPLEYNSPPYPDAVMLNLQQYLDVYNSQEVGQTNFAVQNRKDSRKTATEIQAAQEENSRLSSVQITLYSNFVREVYTFVWGIVQSQALQGKIVFLYMDSPNQLEEGMNDVETIGQDYDIRPAGDIDVIKRQELIAQYKEFWPIIQNTPAAIPFLSRLLRLVFPDEGNNYATLIEQGDPRAVILELVKILDDPGISGYIASQTAALPAMQKGIMINILEQAKLIAEQYQNELAQNNPEIREAMKNQESSEGEEGGEEVQPGINNDAD